MKAIYATNVWGEVGKDYFEKTLTEWSFLKSGRNLTFLSYSNIYTANK